MVKDDASIINNDPTCHIISKQVTPFLRIILCPRYGFRLDQAEVGCRPIWRVASHELLPGCRNPDWQQQGRVRCDQIRRLHRDLVPHRLHQYVRLSFVSVLRTVSCHQRKSGRRRGQRILSRSQPYRNLGLGLGLGSWRNEE